MFPNLERLHGYELGYLPSFRAITRLTDHLGFHHCTDDQAIHTRMLRNDESQGHTAGLTWWETPWETPWAGAGWCPQKKPVNIEKAGRKGHRNDG